MAGPVRHLELRCPACAWREVCGPHTVAAWLRKAGKLRANRVLEPAVLYEVFYAAAGQLTCPKCGKVGLGVGSAAEDLSEWPGARLCECCGKPIPRERVEAIPNTTRCAACQRDDESGRPRERIEYCPRCGAPMEIRVVESGGRTRYVLGCSGNPPCPL